MDNLSSTLYQELMIEKKMAQMINLVLLHDIDNGTLYFEV